MPELPPLVDSHAHLAMPEFDHDRDAVRERFRAAGGALLIHASDDLPAARAARELAQRYGDWFVAGVHPHQARALTAAERDELAALCADPRCAALGEIGLDYHYDTQPRAVQRALYDEQLRFAADRGLPVVLHAREADDDIIAGAQPYLTALPPGILHCWSGSTTLRAAFLPHGWLFSVAGPLTYPRAQALRAAARDLPADRLLTETDAPYLAPQRQRGRRNEPALVAELLPVLAEVRGEPVAALAAAILANAQRFCARRRAQ
ncbi:MAG TPA: TatD family hydrolase [bacterium]|nr:TatD family hydrolase [bacterium]